MKLWRFQFHRYNFWESRLKGIGTGDNCFIGARASLLPGTVIGDNVILGACSVIKGEIPSGSIVAGNPARAIGRTADYANKHKAANDYLIK